MMSRLSIVVIIFLVALVAVTTGRAVRGKRDHNDYKKNPYRIVCYVGTWFFYRGYKLENIDPYLCTHLNYGFAKINETTYEMQMFDQWLDEHYEGYKVFNDLKKKNPLLTTFISLGGWYEGSEKYSDMAKQPNRQRFVKSVSTFLHKYNFDGLDVDWEYPGNRGGDQLSDKHNYNLLMEELRTELDREGYLLTAALSPGKPTIDTAYEDIHKLNDLLDWGNIMTYDYHGGWDDELGHNAPLFNSPSDPKSGNYPYFNINYTIHYYLEKGLKKENMVMGVPFYGRAWTMTDKEHYHLHDPARGMSPAGEFTGEPGVFGYNELCKMVMTNPEQWSTHYDPYYESPYAFNKTIFVGYDDIHSIECKTKYLKEMGLSGGLVWALQNDDFDNRCKGGVSPLLNKVNAQLNGKEKDSYECIYVIPPTPSPSPPTPSTEPTTPPTIPTGTTQSPEPPTPPTPTPSPKPISEQCAEECGKREWCNIPFPHNEHKYIACRDVPGKGWWGTYFDCASRTCYNPRSENCDISC